MTDNATRPEREPWQPDPHPLALPTPAAVVPDRQGRRIVAWLGWHVLELAGVGVPLGLAVTVDGWFAVLALAAGAGWTGHEIQLARRHRALRPGTAHARKSLTSTNAPDSTGKDAET
ncbi:hypothetical protein JOF56_011007 [Kibdelosporangium banguiense]|uniref:Uncharacterized protein n=1 Tax=Kibdelosporangium banguiense TaxID=1365924 RepID=A0ABS4U1V9_9PSEU|nr:hypothetical protein [Kibdelosporangium banguiense]MBP2330622.1 hypothetical protein [Kibdelosporangium banguiense]